MKLLALVATSSNSLALAFVIALASALLSAQAPPTVRIENGASQLLVHGKPFLALAGELGNSSAGTEAEADTILPRLAQMHFNTALMPVGWGEIEPTEGQFDFSIPDHWIDVAREQHMHLVFLWFGSWKNAFSEYAPAWVLADTKRFPRAFGVDGHPLEILSTLGGETMQADAKAYAALMKHLREKDATEQTVLFIQVENEVGVLGLGGRDRSAEADMLFGEAVPAQLTSYLTSHRDTLSPELAAHFHSGGGSWSEVFGEAADEVFMTWHYGLFVEQVVKAGKAAYPLPMYMNAQLPAPFETAGDYPSGGPHPLYQAAYRAAAPSIDFYSPDIYWPDFARWVNLYKAAGNPVFVPEARIDPAPWNALYTIGEARGFGFSPFAVDSLNDNDTAEKSPGHAISDAYATLAELSDTILNAQQVNKTRALVLNSTDLRPSQTVALGGYRFRATLARTWPARELAATTGGMIVIESAPNEFLIAGSGLSIDFIRDPDIDRQIGGIAAIEQLSYADGKRTTARVLNGDQSDQGRRLLMDGKEFHVYRVKLYAYPGGN
jgi:hypothetical protein